MHPMAKAVMASKHIIPATWNPSDKGDNIALSGGNLITGVTANNSTWRMVRDTKSLAAGKPYFELVINTTTTTGEIIVGIGDASATLNGYVGNDIHGWGWQCSAGSPGRYHNGTNNAYGTRAVNNDVIGILLDITAQTLTFYLNGTTQGTAYTGVTATAFFAMVSMFGANNAQATARFASSSWTHAPGVGEIQWH